MFKDTDHTASRRSHRDIASSETQMANPNSMVERTKRVLQNSAVARNTVDELLPGMREVCGAATGFGSAALALASECLINMRSNIQSIG